MAVHRIGTDHAPRERGQFIEAASQIHGLRRCIDPDRGRDGEHLSLALERREHRVQFASVRNHHVTRDQSVVGCWSEFLTQARRGGRHRGGVDYCRIAAPYSSCQRSDLRSVTGGCSLSLRSRRRNTGAVAP